MEIKAQDSNFISEMEMWARDMLELRRRAQDLQARYAHNRIKNRLQASEAEIAKTFSHLTAAQVDDCVKAMQAVLTALGSDEEGAVASLFKMIG